ncbi:hypothetical protein [Desulfosarcina widdelii]|nr:hypothetical protein [Desulfosarcina widdelii]
MRPSANSVVFRPDLGAMALELVEDKSTEFIGLEVMPIFRTTLNTSTFPVIPIEAILAPDKDLSRAPRATYSRSDWEYERGTYKTSEKGTEEPIDDVERELFDAETAGSADFIATERAYKKILRNQEKRISSRMFNEANFTAHAVTNEWDNFSDATPIDDVNDATLSFRNQCGMLPDGLIISYSTFVNLKSCDQIVDRLKYSYPGTDINSMTASLLAQVLNVKSVLVGGAVCNSANKGQDAIITDLWSKEYAQLIKISSGPDISQPGVGRTFLWIEDSQENPIVEMYREEARRCDIVRVRHHVDEAFIQSKDESGNVVSDIAATCAYLLSNISTS